MLGIDHKGMMLGSDVLQIFDSCPNEVQQEVLAHITHRNYEAGERVIAEGAEVDGIYVICSGAVKLTLERQGKNQIFMFNTKGDVIGVENLVEEKAFEYSVWVIEDTMICFIPGEYVRRAIERTPSVFLNLLKIVNHRAGLIEDRSTLLMTDNAEQIVLKTFEKLKSRFGVDEERFLKLRLPVRELANYMCMSKTNLYRVLNQLTERFYLNYEDDRYRLMRV